MEEPAQRTRRLARDLCPGKPLGKKGVPQAAFLRLQQLGIIQIQVNVAPPESSRKNPWEYGKQLYKQRSQVERLFRRIKRFHRIFTRYDKLDSVFLAFIYFALMLYKKVDTFNTQK